MTAAAAITMMTIAATMAISVQFVGVVVVAGACVGEGETEGLVVGLVVGTADGVAGPTTMLVSADELPYESSPLKMAIILYVP